MFRTVNFFSGGEFQGKDLRDSQAFAQEGIAAAAHDGIGPGRYYAGLAVTKVGDTSLEIAPGRYLEGGQYYSLPEDSDLSGAALVLQVSSHLPLVQNKIIALCAWGREIDTDVETRTVRLSLESPQVEFRGLPVRHHHEAAVEIVDDGTESAAPEVPTIPDGLLHFCTVWLNPEGITKIEMVESARLPQSEDIWRILKEIEAWKLRIEAQIETLREAMEAIRKLLLSSAKYSDVVALLLDVALLKQYAALPDDAVNWSADLFINADNSDPTATGWDARIDNGLLFPVEASTVIDLALLNPSDASVAVAGNSLVLPAYDQAIRFTTGDWDGSDTPMAVEQSTWEYDTIEINTWVHTKGWSFNQYADWWASTGAPGHYDATYKDPGRLSVPSYPALWLDSWMKNWTLKPVNIDVLTGQITTISGAALAQTFVSPSTWVTQVELFFTAIVETPVSVFILDVTETGKPDFSAIYASATVSGANLNTHPTGTKFQLSNPVFLQSGKRYAIAVVSDGVQRLATVAGSKFTEGTLFTSAGGDFFEGDLTKDLVFNLWGAKFKHPRTVLSLQPIGLAGGITDLKANLQKQIPSGTELELQYQVNGVWYLFAEDNYPLTALPALVPLRAVFLGTDAVQPALILTEDAIEGSRAKLSFIHFSELRTITPASQSFTVRVRSHGYQDGTHTLSCALVQPDDTVHAATTTKLLEDQDGSTLHTFEFSLATGISSYRVRLVGTRPSAAVEPFAIVERIEAAL